MEIEGELYNPLLKIFRRTLHAESHFLGLFSFKILTSGDRQERCVLLSLHLVKERKRSASAIALLINGGLPSPCSRVKYGVAAYPI